VLDDPVVSGTHGFRQCQAFVTQVASQAGFEITLVVAHVFSGSRK